MTTYQEMAALIAEARRNEQILARMEKVENYLFSTGGLAALLGGLCAHVAGVYGLEAVTLGLETGDVRLAEALSSAGCQELPPGCFWISRDELRLMLGEMAAPVLMADVPPPVRQSLLAGEPSIRSLALLPLWAADSLRGVLCLGSASASRYRPDYETDFLSRLARKVTLGLEAAILAERSRLVQRREAAVEMAGAACHELSQPLTTLGLLVEKARRLKALGHDGNAILGEMEQELDRVNRLVLRISQVSRYVTRPYAQGLQIIDLEAARRGEDGRPEPDKE
jgi:uncharacterized protein YigA (DUF484 family)